MRFQEALHTKEFVLGLLKVKLIQMTMGAKVEVEMLSMSCYKRSISDGRAGADVPRGCKEVKFLCHIGLCR